MPPVTSAVLTGYVGGDDLSLQRTIANLPSGRTVVKAWLTIKQKAGDPDPGLVQKVITATPAAGIGQITDPGSGGTAVLLFYLTPNDTQSVLTPGKPYQYDIQTKLDDGEIATMEISTPNGYMQFLQGVTAAVS